MIATIYDIAMLCVAVASAILTAVASAKKRKTSKNLSTSLQKLEIIEKIPKYVGEAEKVFGAGSGYAKLQYVLNKLQVDFAVANLKYDETEMTGKIESILDTPEKKNNNIGV